MQEISQKWRIFWIMEKKKEKKPKMWSRVMFSILERLWTWCRPGEREREQKRLKKQEILFPVSLFNKIKILLKNKASQSPPPPPKKKIIGFYGASLRAALILECSFGCATLKSPPSIPAIYKKARGYSTFILVCGPKGRKWGLKERVCTKNRG